ncbi:MAG TPA: hypothetical protein VFW87_18390 [Pirellulales bacterium]|nr:hypothetical protein [Pirellulales bacterium]
MLAECGNASARRPYRLEVDVLRTRLEKRGEIVVPTDDDWSLAWDAYVAGQADDAGIVDQISFVVMRRLGITECFTNDRHFHAGRLQHPILARIFAVTQPALVVSGGRPC